MKSKLFYLIVFLAFFSRFVGLSGLPPALNRDEAGIGYNAYSLIQTGRDEHGQRLPLAFQSIGDYKMPLYIYAATIPVSLFGLNDFSIRFWSALAGVVSVITVYYLVRELFHSRIVPQAQHHSGGVLAALLFALNPWAIFYSRIAFEANLALAFFLVGLFFTLRGFKNIGYFASGLGLFLLALLTYSSSLIFIPVFLAVYFFVNRRQLDRQRLVFLAVFLSATALIVGSLWSVSAQKSSITIFSDPATIDYYSRTRTEVFDQNQFLARTWWNKYVFFARRVGDNYLATFSPKFLLTQGGNHPWHQIPGMGYFYPLEIVFAVIGLYWLLRRVTRNPQLVTLLVWLLLAPLPSAITIDAPHATRSFHLLPLILILSALGVAASYPYLKKRRLIIFLIGLLYVVNFSYFAYQYITVYPKKIAGFLPVGIKESLKFVNQKNLDGNIYLTGIHDSTYLYPLVYTGFDPQAFQSQASWTKPDSAGLTNAYAFGQFVIVDDLKDVANPFDSAQGKPAAVILPQDLNYQGETAASFGNYRVFLP